MADRPIGFVTVTVLHAVATGYQYGFDVIDVTGLPSGTVYPALGRLERDGLVQSAWEDPALALREKRPPRRYYHLTREGARALDEALRRFRALKPVKVAAGTPASSRSRG
jgi:DNA-binding PadR family transcriptional regulator